MRSNGGHALEALKSMECCLKIKHHHHHKPGHFQQNHNDHQQLSFKVYNNTGCKQSHVTTQSYKHLTQQFIVRLIDFCKRFLNRMHKESTSSVTNKIEAHTFNIKDSHIKINCPLKSDYITIHLNSKDNIRFDASFIASIHPSDVFIQVMCFETLPSNRFNILKEVQSIDPNRFFIFTNLVQIKNKKITQVFDFHLPYKLFITSRQNHVIKSISGRMEWNAKGERSNNHIFLQHSPDDTRKTFHFGLLSLTIDGNTDSNCSSKLYAYEEGVVIVTTCYVISQVYVIMVMITISKCKFTSLSYHVIIISLLSSSSCCEIYFIIRLRSPVKWLEVDRLLHFTVTSLLTWMSLSLSQLLAFMKRFVKLLHLNFSGDPHKVETLTMFSNLIESMSVENLSFKNEMIIGWGIPSFLTIVHIAGTNTGDVEQISRGLGSDMAFYTFIVPSCFIVLTILIDWLKICHVAYFHFMNEKRKRCINKKMKNKKSEFVDRHFLSCSLVMGICLFLFFCCWSTASHVIVTSSSGTTAILYCGFLLSLSLACVTLVTSYRRVFKMSWTEKRRTVDFVRSIIELTSIDHHSIIKEGSTKMTTTGEPPFSTEVENIESNSRLRCHFMTRGVPLHDHKRHSSGCQGHRSCDVNKCCPGDESVKEKSRLTCRMFLNNSFQSLFPANESVEHAASSSSPLSLPHSSLVVSLSSPSSPSSSSSSSSLALNNSLNLEHESRVIRVHHYDPHASLDSLYAEELREVGAKY